MSVRRWFVILGCVMGLGAASAWSAPMPDPVDEALTRYNAHPALHKLGRGAANFTMGWLEIPLGIHQHKSPHDTGGSFFTGLAYGIVKGAARTGVGLFEVVTFWFPYPDDFAPVLPTLEYFRKDTGRERLPFE